MHQPLILGEDFLSNNALGVYYNEQGKRHLEYKHKEELITSIKTEEDPKIVLRRACTIPGWFLVVLNIRSTITKQHEGRVYDVQVDENLNDEHPNLVIIPSLHGVECVETNPLPYIIINIGQDSVHLPHATCVGMLIAQEIDISEITTITADISEDEGYETNEELPEVGVSSLFITSPADIEVHRKTKLLNAEVEEKYKQ